MEQGEQRQRAGGEERSSGQWQRAWDSAAAPASVGLAEQRWHASRGALGSGDARGTEQRRRVGQSSTRFDLFLNFFIYMHVLDVFLNFVEFTLILGLSARFILLSK